MSDRATPNLPSRDFEATAGFYAALGFTVRFRDSGWMILSRGPLELEFYPVEHDPWTNWSSACFRVGDLDGLFSAFSEAGLPTSHRSIPRLTAPEEQDGLRMFALVDPDGNLIRCIAQR
jgi:hypothetical protein